MLRKKFIIPVFLLLFNIHVFRNGYICRILRAKSTRMGDRSARSHVAGVFINNICFRILTVSEKTVATLLRFSMKHCYCFSSVVFCEMIKVTY